MLDDRLRHANLGVVLGAVRLFMHLTDDMPHLHKDVHDRMKGEKSSVLHSGIVYIPACTTCVSHKTHTLFVLSYMYLYICSSTADMSGIPVSRVGVHMSAAHATPAGQGS